MEVVATQPSTLPPATTTYSAKEYDDVICILQPTSKSAFTICQEVWKAAPQFILQYSGTGLRADGTIEADEDDLEMIGAADTQGPRTPPTAQDVTMHQPHNLDIALRTSSKVKDPLSQFVFGRDYIRCDIPLKANTRDDSKLSSKHFRIFINQYGILMLEDTSTNGLTVDKTVLSRNSRNRTIMLTHGSSIELITLTVKAVSDVQRAIFNVKIPSRNDEEYRKNIADYLARVAQCRKERELLANTGQLFPPAPAFGIAQPAVRTAEIATGDPSLLSAGTERPDLANGWTGNGKYRVVSELGKGAFAAVFKVAVASEGVPQAAKRIDRATFLKNGQVDIKFLNELKIMQKLEHPHIVRYYDYDLTNKYLFILMEFMPCGDLAPHALPKGYLGVSTLKSVTKQLLHALAYIHRQGIVHRDIKPENVLVLSKDPLFYVKLADFGLSKMVDKEGPAAITFCGTLLYCAPEIYPDYEQVRAGLPRAKKRSAAPKPYSTAVDIWSLGTVMYHLLASRPPFKGSGEDQGYRMLRAVIYDDLDFAQLSNRGVNNDGLQFINSMIDIDGENRPPATDLLRHSWLQDTQNVAHIPNLEDSQIFTTAKPEELEDLQEEAEDEWDKPQTESFYRAAGALVKTPTPDAPSLSNGETSAEDKVPNTENDYSDVDIDIDIDIDVDLENEPKLADILDQDEAEFNSSIPIASGQSNATWRRKPRTPQYGQNQILADSNSEAEDDTPQAGQGRLFGEISQDPNTESGVFGGESQPFMQYQASSQQSARHNSPSLFGTESRMYNLNMKSGQPIQSVLRSAVTNSILQGKRYRSTAASGSDESNTSSIEEPAAKRSMVALEETVQPNGRANTASKSPSPDVTRSLSQKVVEMQIEGNPLATLRPIPGCISSEEIHLTTRLSTFGRAPSNTNRYADLNDSRIPRSAFDIYFFAPGNIRGTAWYRDAAVNAVVMTRCSTGIKVNGVRLAPSNQGNVFKIMRLKTGDLIEVYNSARNKLVYRCEFFVGESQYTRGADEDIEVEDNEELFDAARNGLESLSNGKGKEKQKDFS